VALTLPREKMSRGSSWFFIMVMAAIALVFGALGVSHHWGDRGSNLFFFGAWCAAMLMLFALGLQLPLRIAGSRARAMLYNAALAIGAVVVVCLANVAMFRHDVYLDATREAANTPPPQFESVLDGLSSDVSLTYFYNHSDRNAIDAKELLTVAARQNPHFHFTAVDIDKEPAKARAFGARAYNTVVVEADGRRVVVENSADLTQMAFATLRALKKKVDVICFVTGPGESVAEGPPHFHYSHIETLRGHETPGAGDLLQGETDGLDRLQLGLTALGYTVRAIALAKLSAVPPDCSVVAEVGPRHAYAPAEAALLSDYLAGGGRLLAMIDPEFNLQGGLDDLFGKLGLASDAASVIDPLNHYGSDDDKVAVPYYPPHPITQRLALTIFPNTRPIRVAAPPSGVKTAILAASSKDSFLRPVSQTAGAEPTGSDAQRGPVPLAVAVEGRWPGDAADQSKPFRLVLVGNSNFAANSYFPYVSNGDLAIEMVRWLAEDEARPAAKAQAFNPAQQITLTRDQMRSVFLAVEVLLPLSVILLGGAVWWKRR
jgi:ABC-2 type transport system permease protein